MSNIITDLKPDLWLNSFEEDLQNINNSVQNPPNLAKAWGSTIDVSQATTSNQPIFRGRGSGWEFGDDWWEYNNFNENVETGITWVWVAKRNPSANVERHLAHLDGSGARVIASYGDDSSFTPIIETSNSEQIVTNMNFDATVLHVCAMRVEISEGSLIGKAWHNSGITSEDSTPASGDLYSSMRCIGAVYTGAFPFGGNIKEVLDFDAALNDSQVADLVSHLAQKHKINQPYRKIYKYNGSTYPSQVNNPPNMWVDSAIDKSAYKDQSQEQLENQAGIFGNDEILINSPFTSEQPIFRGEKGWEFAGDDKLYMNGVPAQITDLSGVYVIDAQVAQQSWIFLDIRGTDDSMIRWKFNIDDTLSLTHSDGVTQNSASLTAKGGLLAVGFRFSASGLRVVTYDGTAEESDSYVGALTAVSTDHSQWAAVNPIGYIKNAQFTLSEVSDQELSDWTKKEFRKWSKT